MSALKGDLSSIRSLKASLRALPLSMAHDVAQRAAPAMTDETLEAYDSGVSVYGEPRPPAADGGRMTLVATGQTRRDVKFIATGTIVRCVLSTPWAKYLIGKYGILPNGALPVSFTRRLQHVAKDSKVAL